MTYINDFQTAMASHGIVTDEKIISDGELHRFHIKGDKPGTVNGWYILHDDIVPVGIFGCWKRDINKTWCAKKDNDLSAQEKESLKKKMELSKEKFKKVREDRYLKARVFAKQRFDNSLLAKSNHPYLINKGIKPPGTRQHKEKLVIPLVDVDGNIHSLQYIYPDGKKYFLKNGCIKGNFFCMGEIKEIIYICEGFATGASIHSATNSAVVIAFNSGNLLAVAKKIGEKYHGKKVIICADNDQFTIGNPGITKAKKAAEAINADLATPDFSHINDLTSKPTDFNDLALLIGIDEVKKQLSKEIKLVTTSRAIPSEFKLTEAGLFYIGNGEEDKKIFISSKLEVTALVRDKSSENWGRLLEFNDADGSKHIWSMPMEMLKGSGEELRGELLRLGLQIAPGTKARNWLAEYITSSKPKERARCINRTGWYQEVFVLPNRTIGESSERIIYQSDNPSKNYKQLGELSEWRENISLKCVGNSRLVFAVSSAFAAALLHPANIESGGIHFVGDSSCGKTTALRVAASVYGAPDYLQRWRATSNGLESIATLHSDTLLILDELAQVDPKEAGEIAYMLSNGSGKVRAGRSGNARPRHEWRLLFLSAGEIGLAQHMSDGGKKIKAGQAIRLIDIPADAGSGLGLFENLHGFDSASSFSNYLLDVTTNYYGSPAISFIELITRRENFNNLKSLIKKLRGDFIKENLPQNSGGQVNRACERFALIAVAGELATRYGITGWPQGEAEKAAVTCFRAWIERRGGTENQERKYILSQVQSFFETHGESRFTEWKSTEPRTHNRAGFKKTENEITLFYVMSQAFKTDICIGFEQKTVAKILLEEGWLEPGSDGKPYRRESLPGIGQTRCYVFNKKMWEDKK